MRLACSTLSFNGHSLKTALASISSLGFDLADLAAFEDPEWGHLDSGCFCEDPIAAGISLKKTASAFGLDIAAFNVAFAGGPKRALLEAAVLRTASIAGATVVTFSADRENPELQARRFKDLVSIAADLDTSVTVENHVDTLCETPDGACRLLDSVPGLGLTFDPSHVIMQNQELSSWAMVFPRVRHVHVRDASGGMMQARMGEGRLKAGELVDMLERAAYSGVLSVEYLKPSQIGAGEYDDVSNDISAARKALIEAMDGAGN